MGTRAIPAPDPPANLSAPVQSQETKEQDLHGPPSSKLDEAVRALVREELDKRNESPTAKKDLGWNGVLWVSVTIANIVLLITQLPDSLLKNTSVEFASKLVGYVFGGLLLVYSSRIRQWITTFQQVRWFQITQTILLIGLLSARLPLFSLQPNLMPHGVQVYIDDAVVKVRPSHPIRLALGNHVIRIAPLPGQDKLQDGTQMKEQEFVLRWPEMVRHVFERPYRPRWSVLYPLQIYPASDDSVVIIRKSDGPLNPDVRDQQELQSIEFQNDGSLKVDPEGGASLYLPYGENYSIQEEMKAKTLCRVIPLKIIDHKNTVEQREMEKACGK